MQRESTCELFIQAGNGGIRSPFCTLDDELFLISQESSEILK